MWKSEGSVKTEDSKQPFAVRPALQTPVLPVEERRTVAWVGKSVIFKGTLISSEDMTIDGQVEGTIEIRDQGLTIGPDADIRADIVAKTITIHGTVIGNIRATDKVDIRETGRIDGDLVSPRISLADGALVRGRVDTVSETTPGAAKPKKQLAVS
jgi:cytoskeletal protein CcmA (bactofilin family)